MKMHSTEGIFVIRGTEKCTVCRCVCECALFSPEMSQAGAVKGLNLGAKQKELNRCNLFSAKCHWNERKPTKKTILKKCKCTCRPFCIQHTTR